MKNKSKFIILALIILISVIGISYAFFVYDKTGDNSSKLIFGDIYLKMNEGKDTITLTNVFPETAEEARKRTDNQITFTISGINTTTNKDIWYEIMLNEGNVVSGRTRFNPEDLVFDLVEVNADKTETYLVDATSFSDIKAKRIWVETVNKNTTSEVNKTYKLRMWLSEDVFISDTNPNATYDVETFESSYASVKVSVYGDFVEKEIVGYITYDVNGADVAVPAKQPIYKDIDNIVEQELIDVGSNLFCGWATSKNGKIVYQKGDIITSINDITLYAIWGSKSFVTRIENNLQLSLPDSEGVRFVYGANVENNYVWYSGKMWRIVGINDDDSIKMITQGNMTTITMDTSYDASESKFYNDSQVRSWLNNVFLPTLHDSEHLIKFSDWDYTRYGYIPTQKNNTLSIVSHEKVGLLNIYEFGKTGGTISSSTTNTFLNNGYNWWLSSAKTANEDGSISGWLCNQYGVADTHYSTIHGFGIRPVVNLVSDVNLKSGIGTKDNPYFIEGDIKIGTENNLLNTRISGEYIVFNNEKFRIVGIEKSGLIKVVSTVARDAFSYGDYETDTGFPNVPSYYNYDFIRNLDWRQGKSYGGSYVLAQTDYSSRSMSVGLLNYGEMFASQFGDGYNSSKNFWLLTVHVQQSKVWYVDYTGALAVSKPNVTMSIFPAVYLDGEVIIYDVDGDGEVGNGMYNNPYEIKLLK